MKMTTEQEIEELLSSERNGIAHARGIARKHNTDLPEWCNRQRRRDGIRRIAVATCAIVLFAIAADTTYANPPCYTELETCGTISGSYTCMTINKIIGQ